VGQGRSGHDGVLAILASATGARACAGAAPCRRGDGVRLLDPLAPPPRSDTPLNEEEKKRLKDDLIKVRERTERQATGAPEPAAAKGNTKSSGSATRNP
jgi:hypothetical protein